MDGGSVERWEDEGYRKVYGEILRGNWEGFDAFQIGRSGTPPGGKCRRKLVQVVTAVRIIEAVETGPPSDIELRKGD